MIYVVVRFAYDYYEFQDLLGASVDRDSAESLAREISLAWNCPYFFEDSPELQDYIDNDCTHVLYGN